MSRTIHPFFIPTIDSSLKRLTTTSRKKFPIILLVEENTQHAYRFECAFQESGILSELIIIPTAEMAMHYLSKKPYDKERSLFPLPEMIILDLGVSQSPDVLAYINSHSDLENLKVALLRLNEGRPIRADTIDQSIDGYFLITARFDKLAELLLGLNLQSSNRVIEETSLLVSKTQSPFQIL